MSLSIRFTLLLVLAFIACGLGDESIEESLKDDELYSSNLDNTGFDDVTSLESRNVGTITERSAVHKWCCSVARRYPDLIPNKTWGSLKSRSLRSRWRRLGCNKAVGGSSKSNCKGSQRKNTRTRKWYRYFSQKLTWSQAKAKCQSYRGWSIATFQSLRQYKYIIGRLRYPSAWIGLRVRGKGKTAKLTWADSSRSTFTDWARGEPNDYKNNEDCVQTGWKKNGKWNDLNCNKKLGFICNGPVRQRPAKRRPRNFLQICTSTSGYRAKKSDELSFSRGATIYIILKNGNGWKTGMLNGKYGRVQEKYLRFAARGSGGKTNARTVPMFYLQKVYANKDYANKGMGGLAFKKGSTVYVLLRNRNGWCTGMANGKYGTFQESAVSSSRPSTKCRWNKTRWSKCSKTCGAGRRRGVRTQSGGRACRRRIRYRGSCNKQPCNSGPVSSQRKPGYFLQTCTSTSSYRARRRDELSFRKGATIYIILRNGNGWCTGMLNGRYGRVPERYLRQTSAGSGAFSTNRVPKIYLAKMTGKQDYRNTRKGGLSFKRGQTVYVLLRNGRGWCTGMSGGRYGTFRERAVVRFGSAGCKWGALKWSKCSKTCGGYRTGVRTQTGGSSCTRTIKYRRSCRKCPSKSGCKWGSLKWSKCTKTCGGYRIGVRTQTGGSSCTKTRRYRRSCRRCPQAPTTNSAECSDKSKYARVCPRWKRNCKRSKFVQANCKKTCNLCTTSANPGCSDNATFARYCSRFKRNCQQSSFLRTNCKKTCGCDAAAAKKPGYFLQTCVSTSSYKATKKDELTFSAGANIYIILRNGNGWCTGMLNGRYGRVPERVLRQTSSGSGTFSSSRTPKVYLKKMVAKQDYTNKAKDGLKFKKGQPVYLLLRNSNGMCTGMSGGKYGTFREEAVAEFPKCTWGRIKWSKCSKTCGGRTTGTRTQNGGSACTKTYKYTRSCGVKCPETGTTPTANCKWRKWTSTKCSRSCGSGRLRRYRRQYGGKSCRKVESVIRTCNAEPCPTPATVPPTVPPRPTNPSTHNPPPHNTRPPTHKPPPATVKPPTPSPATVNPPTHQPPPDTVKPPQPPPATVKPPVPPPATVKPTVKPPNPPSATVKPPLPPPATVKPPLPPPATVKPPIPTPVTVKPTVKPPLPTPATVQPPVPPPATVKPPHPPPVTVKPPLPPPATVNPPTHQPPPATVKPPTNQPPPATVKPPLPTPATVKPPLPPPATVKPPVPTPVTVKPTVKPPLPPPATVQPPVPPPATVKPPHPPPATVKPPLPPPATVKPPTHQPPPATVKPPTHQPPPATVKPPTHQPPPATVKPPTHKPPPATVKPPTHQPPPATVKPPTHQPSPATVEPATETTAGQGHSAAANVNGQTTTATTTSAATTQQETQTEVTTKKAAPVTTTILTTEQQSTATETSAAPTLASTKQQDTQADVTTEKAGPATTSESLPVITTVAPQTTKKPAPPSSQKCADNMVYMAVCGRWESMCATSNWMKTNCEKTCKVCKPINCTWDEWSDWTTCTKTCDGGIQARQRTVAIESQFGGEACQGGSVERRNCNTKGCPLDCTFGEYGDWSQCTKSCGAGTQLRTREIIQQAENDGKACGQGQTTETRSCNTHNCAIHCQFGEWGNWTTCDRNCGRGTQYRSREVKTYAKFGGEVCAGDAKEVQACNHNPCPVDCEWNAWHEWEQCSKSCEAGITSRTRNIKTYAQLGGQSCNGTAFETKSCNSQACPKNCEWNEFGQWEPCTKTCGGGRQARSRTIKTKETSGGTPCQGKPTQTRSCNSKPCPRNCSWKDFGHWDSCSKSCGGGQQTRSRGIEQKAAYGGKDCVGDSKETRACNKAACKAKVNCQWGNYGNWGVCSKSCAGGFQTRVRDIEQAAQNGGEDCPGASTDLRTCNEHTCPVECRWGSYSPWSECTKTCGGGIMESTRKVEQEAENGGVPCVGSPKRTMACNKESCPVDCQWGAFGEWGGCSQSCGEGIQTRTRKMIAKPKFGGMLCTGYTTQSRSCNVQPCAADCEWSHFSVWSSCSKTCGGGTQVRSRYIQRAAINGGKECSGNASESRDCSANTRCPVDCQWGQFGNWSECSQDCGGGWQRRSRTIKQKALDGGKECSGCALDSRACNTRHCPRNCKWGPFGGWSECSKPCGGGSQNRTRVLQQTARNGGMDCVGEATQFQDCNLQSCPVDCKWSDWSKWGLCSKTCGGGMHGRNREIVVKERNGGKGCVGGPLEMQGCNMQPCLICKDSPRYAKLCPTWTDYCAISAFVKGCCRKTCRLC